MKEFFIKKKIEKYKRHIHKHLHDPLYLEELAELYLLVSQKELAVKYYQSAIEAYYRDDSVLGEEKEFIFDVCWKLLNLDPLNMLASGTLGQEYCSVREFDEAINVYKSCASKLIKVNRYAEAIDQYRNVLVLQPDDIGIHQNCFALLWRLRRKEEAVQELRKIAELAEKAGNIAKALECYSKAVKIMPTDAELQTELLRLKQLARKMEKPLRLVVNT